MTDRDNNCVGVQTFLQFLSRYNTVIIEVLIGLILLTVVYLAYRSFFGPEDTSSSGSGADLEKIEKALQKMLENQGTGTGAAAAVAAPADGAPAQNSEELESLKLQISAKDHEIADLKAKLGAGGAAPAGDPAAAATPGMSAEEKKQFETKIADLEARLAEYEIISEDIADLSFYKEENVKLQKELEALKGAPAVAAAPAPVEAAPTPEPEPVAAPAPEPIAAAPESPPPAPEPEPVPEPAAAPAPEPVVEAAAPAEPPAPAAPVDDPLTPPPTTDAVPSEDPLLKELAAAAEQANAAAAAASAATPADATKGPDDTQLMNQFENFVKKG